MDLIYSILTISVWFLSTYFVTLVLLVVFEKKRDITEHKENYTQTPNVSIIMPAFNEEASVLPALQSLCQIDYPKDLYEVIVVNDGSSDRTSHIISDFISAHNGTRFTFIDRRQNKGKAFSLNEGIAAATSEYVACMDSDSVVKPDILRKTVGLFDDKKVGAVTVRVHVQEPKNLLEKIVDIEYVVGLSLSMKILSYLDCMHVTPGPFSIYRRDMIQKIGGFNVENITEDMEIAFRMHKGGYRIACTLQTGVYTKIPSTLKGLYNQRRRWYSGSLITLLQHKDVMLNPRLGAFGVFFLPLNYATITLGLILAVYSVFLFISGLYKEINYLILTNFEMLPFTLPDIDILKLSIFHFFMLTAILSVVFLTKASLGVLKRRMRENIEGFIGFMLFFFLYQIFWFSSFYSVFLGKRVKWR
jgi:cellulose synthase/poly-beta-1,6-N-acetylglucosamine synthase-like glycosyltransferase